MSRLEELREFHKLGGENINSALAYRVYADLKTTNRYSDINKSFDEDLGIVYVTATEGGRKHLFLPLLISHKLNLYKLEHIQSKLGQMHKQSALHLAICDSASNVLYYTITRGFKDDHTKWSEKFCLIHPTL